MEISKMRKERKVLIEKLDELSMQRDAEYEMGCGFGSKEIYETFAPYFEELETKLAATYGMSLVEYNDKMIEINDMIMRKMFEEDELPFN
jgi:hypothetical protein